MSFLDFLKESYDGFLNLICPNCCLCCGKTIENRREYICAGCLKNLPYTQFYLSPFNNDLFFLLQKRGLNVSTTFALFYFSEENVLQKIIHVLKYKNHPDLGRFLGREYGRILREFDFVNDYDVIIPIPLHLKRERQRGYNQSEMIARGLQDQLQIEIDNKSVVRIKNTNTQTAKNAQERMEDMKDAFLVVDSSSLQGKHILLVDDVLTTGSTVVSCAQEILKKCKRVTISICVLCRAQ